MCFRRFAQALNLYLKQEYDQLNGDLAWDYFLDNRSRIGLTAQYASNQSIESPTGTGSDFQDPSFDRFYLALKPLSPMSWERGVSVDL